MPFNCIVKRYVDRYVNRYLQSSDFYTNYFSFITDDRLKLRLEEEFRAARYIYKLLEGLEAKDWLQQAQVRMQILQYASIYEACIHHLLFDRLANRKEVKDLQTRDDYHRVTLPPGNAAQLAKILKHNREDIIPMAISKKSKDITKIRFDEKASVAHQIGLIEINQGLRRIGLAAN